MFVFADEKVCVQLGNNREKKFCISFHFHIELSSKRNPADLQREKFPPRLIKLIEKLHLSKLNLFYLELIFHVLHRDRKMQQSNRSP